MTIKKMQSEFKKELPRLREILKMEEENLKNKVPGSFEIIDLLNALISTIDQFLKKPKAWHNFNISNGIETLASYFKKYGRI